LIRLNGYNELGFYIFCLQPLDFIRQYLNSINIPSGFNTSFGLNKTDDI